MKKLSYFFRYLSFYLIFLSVIVSSCKTKKEQTSTKQSDKINKVSIQKEQDSINQVQKEKEVDSIAKINIYNPFLTLDTDEVIAYDYETNFDSAKRFIIDDEGKLNPTVAKQRTLTKTQVSTLKTFLGSTDTYGENRPDCFEPHLGIVFYKDDKVVAHVSICISCRHLDSSVEIPATTYRGYRTDGFNPKAIEFLNDFCQSLEFSYCKN